MVFRRSLKWAIPIMLALTMAGGAEAQTTAAPVIPGFQASPGTFGCPAGNPVSCFVPYDSTNPLATTATISGSVTVNSAATAGTSPPSYSAGAQPLSQNLSGGLRSQISLGGTDLTYGQKTSANSVPVVLPSDQVVPVSGTITAAQATAANLNATVVGTGTFGVQTNPGARTPVTLDVKTVTTGGTAVTALTSGHKSAGGWIQNPSNATINLCINEISTASGTTSSGDTTCIIPGQTYNLVPSSGAVSVISSDNTHPFSGYGFQ